MRILLGILTALAICVPALFLVGCALSPEQKQAATQAFQQMLVDGQISQQQYDAIIAAMTAGDWSQVRDIAISVGLGVVSSLTGVRVWRGSVNNRKGSVGATDGVH